VAKIKIAINGFGRIGRAFFRQTFKNHNDFEIVAINDLSSAVDSAYLLKHDSVYGAYNHEVSAVDGQLTVDDSKILFLRERDPAKLPWKELGIDVVVEATGKFETTEKASAHLEVGAKRVVITAPAHDDVTPTSTPNVNEEVLSHAKITSCASCTTNAASPLIKILEKSVGIEKIILNTAHAYTSSQELVDNSTGLHDIRRERSGAINIIPATTGAALAETKLFPELTGKFDALALRVPVAIGSILDMTFIASKKTSREEINEILKTAAQKEEWKDILEVSDELLVSSDIIGNPHGSIVDLVSTRVVDGNLVKILSWYDNEWGYAAMLIKHTETISKLL